MRFVVPTSVLLSCVLLSIPAVGGEAERVRLKYVAPDSCLGAQEFVERVGEIGAPMNLTLEGGTRIFKITIEEGETFTGRLVIHDTWDEETERVVTGNRCDEVTESLALFVSLALESPVIKPDRQSHNFGLPEPNTSLTRFRTPGRLGSGGIALSSFVGTNQDGGLIGGGQAFAALRVGKTRFGAVGAFTYEAPNTLHRGEYYVLSSSGMNGRLGAMIGWGAPWNDSVVGFRGEIGVAAGGHSGIAPPQGAGWSCRSAWSSCTFVRGLSKDIPVRERFLSPYLALSLIFQIPIKKSSVRPFIGETTVIIPGSYVGVGFIIQGEAGVVWQAW